MTTKELLVVGGPNGAGKTTFAEAHVAKYGLRYLSADVIKAELGQGNAPGSQFAAGQEYLRRVREQIEKGESFIVESTLSGRSFRRVLHAARDAGFSITIAFIILESAGSCVKRIQERVGKGGHNVPESDIRRRFTRSLSNFWNLYRPLSDYWVMVYNEGNEPYDVAIGTSSKCNIRSNELFKTFMELIDND